MGTPLEAPLGELRLAALGPPDSGEAPPAGTRRKGEPGRVGAQSARPTRRAPRGGRPFGRPRPFSAVELEPRASREATWRQHLVTRN